MLRSRNGKLPRDALLMLVQPKQLRTDEKVQDGCEMKAGRWHIVIMAFCVHSVDIEADKRQRVCLRATVQEDAKKYSSLL
jgi:hypothetical protein